MKCREAILSRIQLGQKTADANYASYIIMHILPIWKKNSHLFTVKQVLNFTLDISDGLIINRFTQRDEKSRILLKQFTFH